MPMFGWVFCWVNGYELGITPPKNETCPLKRNHFKRKAVFQLWDMLVFEGSIIISTFSRYPFDTLYSAISVLDVD